MPESNYKSFVAGAAAGAIEGTITYPFEFAKTRLQLVGGTGVSRNPFQLIYQIARKEGFVALYAGCIPAVLGNTAKAGVRFLTYDYIGNLLRDEHGVLSKTGGAVAGLGAGVFESVFALTPAESIKTAFIDDRRSTHPRYNTGFARGLAQMIRDHGISVCYQGVVPVTLRQAANSLVRLGSYNAIKTSVQKYKGDTRSPLSSVETFAIGAIVGTITVYATMPIDCVKTRMQAVDARARYRSSFHCLVDTFHTDGVSALWRGSTARLGRLMLSGGIVFTIYEKLMTVL